MDNEKSINSSRSSAGRKVRNDIILIVTMALIVAVAALLLFLFKSEGDMVVVTVDGELYGEYSLGEDKTVEIKNGDGSNLLVIEGGRAYVTEASCPDGICSSHRPVRYNGESIICLPNKVVIEIRSQSSISPDIIT